MLSNAGQFSIMSKKRSSHFGAQKANIPIKNNIRKSVVRICSFDFDEKKSGKTKGVKTQVDAEVLILRKSFGKIKESIFDWLRFPGFRLEF